MPGLLHSRARRVLATTALAGAALGCGGSAAVAATTRSNLTVSCQFPKQSGSYTFVIDTTAPTGVSLGQSTGALPFVGRVALGDETHPSAFLGGLTRLGATSLSGSGSLYVTSGGIGGSSDERAPFTISSTTVIDAGTPGVGLQFSGELSPKSFSDSGTESYGARFPTLLFRAVGPNGEPVQVDNVAGTTESDTDPNTFDVPCTFLPTGPPTLLAQIAAFGPPASPNPTPTPATPTPSPTPEPSHPSPTPTPTPQSSPTPNPSPTPGYGPDGNYSVAGSATLENLVKGSVPLTGSMVADLNLATQVLTGNLQLDQTTASLKALGFLPVVAKVRFVPTAPVVGAFDYPALNVTAKVRIKLPSVTLFGLLLAGGAGCQTKAISEIPLSSKSFDILEGGTLSGSFAIGDLTNCGGLTGIVSPLTAGKGNAIALKLSPR